MARFCKYCGTELSDQALFCKGCGRQLPKAEPERKDAYESEAGGAAKPAPVFCRYCGGIVNPGAVFCKSCGARLDRDFPRMAQEYQAPQNDRSSRDYRAAQQETRPATKRRRSPVIPVVAALLVMALFVSFVYPGYIRTRFLGGGSGGQGGSGSVTETHIAGGTAVPAEPAGPPMIQGNSKEIEIEPIQGMKITAEKNALDYDREFKVTELSAEQRQELEIQMAEQGETVLTACEIDLGMAPDEYLPGYYNVEMDLSEYDIPEELYDAVRVTRIDDNGNQFVYASEFDGKSLKYKSRQNSVIVTSVLSAVLIGIAAYYVYDQVTQDTRYYKGKTLMVHELPNFVVFFAAEDFTDHGAPKVFLEKAHELEAIKEKIAAKIQESHPAGDGSAKTDSSDIKKMTKEQLAELTKELAKDPEYQAKKKELEESYPEELKRILQYLETARTYLAGQEQKLRVPAYKMKIYLKNKLDGGEANTHKVLFDNPAMSVAIGQIYESLTGGPVTSLRYREDRMEALLISICHEYTHACQYEYYTTGISELISASLKLVEATACVTEVEALKYFINKGDLPALANQTIEQLAAVGSGTSGALTNRDFPIWYAMPLNEPAPQTGGSNIGYALAYFLDYLNQEEKPKKTADIMNIYSAGMSFSDAMIDAYDIEPDIFQLDFMDFMRESRDKGTAHKDIVNDAFSGSQQYFGTYTFSMAKKQLLYQEARGSFAGSNLRFNDAFMKMHRLSLGKSNATDGKKALLVVTDPENDADGDRITAMQDATHGLLELRFADDGKGKLPAESEYLIDETKNILWIEEMKEQNYWISEIMGLADGWLASRVAFDAIALTPPDYPEILLNQPGESMVTFRLPSDRSPFYTNSYVKKQMQEFGMCVRKTGEKDVKKMQFFPADQVGKDVAVQEKQVNIDLKDLDKVVACAYFKLNDKYYFGPESELQEDIFGTYDIDVTVKEYSSMLDSLVGAMPNTNDLTQYKNTYQDISQKPVGVPQKATLTVINNGTAGQEIGSIDATSGSGGLGTGIGFETGNSGVDLFNTGISSAMGLSENTSVGLSNEILVILTYGDPNGPKTIDITQNYGYDAAPPTLSYNFKGVIPFDQQAAEGDPKDKKTRGKDVLKVTLDFDAGNIYTNPAYDMQYPQTFSGPLELEFIRDTNGKYSVRGESKFGYGSASTPSSGQPTEMDKIMASLNLKFWYTLEGTKADFSGLTVTPEATDLYGNPSNGSGNGNGSGIPDGWQEAPPVGYEYAPPLAGQ